MRGQKEGAWTKDDLASVAGSAVFEGGGWREVSASKDRGEWRRRGERDHR